jgi:hypothetical protein
MPRRITTPSEGGGRKRGDDRCALLLKLEPTTT